MKGLIWGNLAFPSQTSNASFSRATSSLPSWVDLVFWTVQMPSSSTSCNAIKSCCLVRYLNFTGTLISDLHSISLINLRRSHQLLSSPPGVWLNEPCGPFQLGYSVPMILHTDSTVQKPCLKPTALNFWIPLAPVHLTSPSSHWAFSFMKLS